MSESTEAPFVITIATFRRADLLDKLLESLVPEISNESVDIVVVDNDDQASARKVIEAFRRKHESVSLRYFVEAIPGIAAARNRAVRALGEKTQAVIFVDDDEWVGSGWLRALIDCWERSGADVVTGPVSSELPETTPRWIERGGFLELASQDTGPYPFLPATNNTLVAYNRLRTLGDCPFDNEFGITGGSDNEMFNRLRQKGGVFWWCNEAVVFEHIPLSRLSWKWIWRRGVRGGNVLARIQLQNRSRGYVLLGGLARLAYGVVVTGLSLVRGNGFQYRDFVYVMRSVGFFGASVDRLVHEYSRN